MVDDFDWNGETLAIGDGEGGSLVLAQEPTQNQQGVDTPGLLEGQFQTWLRGGFNLDFSQGPPDPSQAIDVASSTAGSNFMPGWRFVQSSNTNITLTQNRDATLSAGSNLRFSFASGLASDEAYVETLLPVRGSLRQRAGDFVEFWAKASSAGAGTAIIEGQYLTVDGALTGSATRFSVNPPGTTYTQIPLFGGNANRMAPADARFLRLRLIADRQAGTGAFTMDFADGQRYAAQPYGAVFSDFADPTRSPGVIRQSNGLLSAAPDIGNSNFGGGVIGPHLVPLDFVLINVPASATTELKPSDNALGIGTPRLRTPWDGSVVGLSYRLSTSIGAGTLNFQATVGGSSVWSPFGALTSTASQHGYATQAIGTDTFFAGDTLGVRVVTNGSFSPTTMDLHVVLWLALNYTGA